MDSNFWFRARDYPFRASVRHRLRPQRGADFSLGFPGVQHEIGYQMGRAAGLNKEDGSAIIKVFEGMVGVTIGRDD